MTGATIVLADDATLIRDLLRVTLEEIGGFVVVGEAADGSAAIDVVRDAQPDLLLLDLSMPRMDGLEAIPHLLAASPTTRIVVLSGFMASKMEPAAKALGALRYVEKGVSPEHLVRTLREVLAEPAPDRGSPGNGGDEATGLVFTLVPSPLGGRDAFAYYVGLVRLPHGGV